jgi:hypothetical protein
VRGAPSEAPSCSIVRHPSQLKYWRAERPAIRPFGPGSEGAPAGGASQRKRNRAPLPCKNQLHRLSAYKPPPPPPGHPSRSSHALTNNRPPTGSLVPSSRSVYRHADIMAAPRVTNKTSGGNAAFHNFNNDFAHIADPNERRRLALAEIDKAPFGWYHVRACVVAGIGFFTDSYDVSSPHIYPQTRLTSPRSSPSTW